MMSKQVEKHRRIPRDEVNVCNYGPLINKVLHQLARRYGQYVHDMSDEMTQEGYIGLLSAKKDYDPERGTYVTLAWLRIRTYMLRYLASSARYQSKLNYLEDLQPPADAHQTTWEDMFPSNEVNYEAVARLSVRDEKDLEIIEAFTNGIPRKCLPKYVGLTIIETKRRLERIRGEMLAVTSELYTLNND